MNLGRCLGTADRPVGIGCPGAADRLVGIGAEPTLGDPRPRAEPTLGDPRPRAEPTLGDPRPRAEPTLGDPREACAQTREWYSRGYLPHRDHPELLQMITYRLADSLPADAVDRLHAELQALPPEQRSLHRRKRVEELADAGYGSCLLRIPEVAGLVVESWRHYDHHRYELLAYVVMPNHVHVLIEVHEGSPLSRIVQGWKGYTGMAIRRLLVQTADRPVGMGAPGTADRPVGMGTPGTADRPVGMGAEPTLGGPRHHAEPRAPVWHREFWDRFIRDQKHLQAAVAYILNNPVKAGLAAAPGAWRWSWSAWGLLGPPTVRSA